MDALALQPEHSHPVMFAHEMILYHDTIVAVLSLFPVLRNVPETTKLALAPDTNEPIVQRLVAVLYDHCVGKKVPLNVAGTRSYTAMPLAVYLESLRTVTVNSTVSQIKPESTDPVLVIDSHELYKLRATKSLQMPQLEQYHVVSINQKFVTAHQVPNNRCP